MDEMVVLVPSNRWKNFSDPLTLGITDGSLVMASGRTILAVYPFVRIIQKFGRVRSMVLEVWSNQTARVYINDEKIIDITNPRKDHAPIWLT